MTSPTFAHDWCCSCKPSVSSSQQHSTQGKQGHRVGHIISQPDSRISISLGLCLLICQIAWSPNEASKGFSPPLLKKSGGVSTVLVVPSLSRTCVKLCYTVRVNMFYYTDTDRISAICEIFISSLLFYCATPATLSVLNCNPFVICQLCLRNGYIH